VIQIFLRHRTQQRRYIEFTQSGGLNRDLFIPLLWKKERMELPPYFVVRPCKFALASSHKEFTVGARPSCFASARQTSTNSISELRATLRSIFSFGRALSA
jgi:hypothetical protein